MNRHVLARSDVTELLLTLSGSNVIGHGRWVWCCINQDSNIASRVLKFDRWVEKENAQGSAQIVHLPFLSSRARCCLHKAIAISLRAFPSMVMFMIPDTRRWCWNTKGREDHLVLSSHRLTPLSTRGQEDHLALCSHHHTPLSRYIYMYVSIPW